MGILTYIYLIRHSEQLKIKGKKINVIMVNSAKYDCESEVKG